MSIRTRFAPSPTGHLHIGGVRTALYSWLFAKRSGGSFILRIEDTDKERSTNEAVDAILEGMRWLGLDWDEGPVHQMERLPRYQEVVNQLLESGHAYRCTCSKERLETLREQQMANKEKPRYDGHCRQQQLLDEGQDFVVRFKNPTEGAVAFHDEVYGDITVLNQELDDLILIRTDGLPTYNFAVVVDDWDMKISHVIRGDDHLSNTPRQINLYRALGADVPVFAHLPMILGEDGKRLSKRHGAVSVLEFREMGYLPEAVLNYLVRLGWSHGDMEIFSKDEMISYFDLAHVGRGVSTFNYDKLTWLNQHYLKTLPPEQVAKELQWQFDSRGWAVSDGPSLSDIIPLFAERSKTLSDLCDNSRYFYEDYVAYDDEAVAKHLLPARVAIQTLTERFDSQESWDVDSIQKTIAGVCQDLSLGMGKVAQPLRVAVTGSTQSPSIDATLHLLGKSRVMLRLHHVLAHWPIENANTLNPE